MAKKFYATIEFLGGQPAVILTLTNQAGEWAGSGRIELRSYVGRNIRAALYEEAYRHASFNAHSKGGRLERFSVEGPPFLCDGCPTLDSCLAHERCAFPESQKHAAWLDRRETCGASVTPIFQRRPTNALNVEPIQPWARCLDKKPLTWPKGASSLRWIASGGEAWIFGPCSANCPRAKK